MARANDGNMRRASFRSGVAVLRSWRSPGETKKGDHQAKRVGSEMALLAFDFLAAS
jgi:hypothetical protein